MKSKLKQSELCSEYFQTKQGDFWTKLGHHFHMDLLYFSDGIHVKFSHLIIHISDNVLDDYQTTTSSSVYSIAIVTIWSKEFQ